MIVALPCAADEAVRVDGSHWLDWLVLARRDSTPGSRGGAGTYRCFDIMHRRSHKGLIMVSHRRQTSGFTLIELLVGDGNRDAASIDKPRN